MIRHRTPAFSRHRCPAADRRLAPRGARRGRALWATLPVSRRGFLALAVGCVWGWWLMAGLPVVGQQEASAPPAYRYLFIVDLSRELANEAAAVKRTVFEMIRSGFDGQARPGDLCGIWTLTDTVNTQHSPPVAWRAELRQSFADHALRFLNAQRWRGAARYDLALAALTNAVRRSPVLTAFIFTARPFSVPDAPFSASLDAFYRRVAADPQLAQRAFATVLTSREGSFLSAEVSFVGDPIRVPPADRGPAAPADAKPPAVAAAAAAPATAADRAGEKLEPKPPLALTPRTAYETAAAEKPLIDLEALLAAARQAAKETKEPAHSLVEPPADSPTASKDSPPPPLAGVGQSEIAIAPTDAAQTSSRLNPTAAPRETSPGRLVALLPEFLFTGIGFVVVAWVLVLAAVLLALLFARPPRPDERPSLISQSMDRPEE